MERHNIRLDSIPLGDILHLARDGTFRVRKHYPVMLPVHLEQSGYFRMQHLGEVLEGWQKRVNFPLLDFRNQTRR